jgi:uncharacterized damage-inducible protein DinB
MPFDELQKLLMLWDEEAKDAVRMMEALPADQYDFRPDAGGRSIGELAWHIAEGDAYNSCGVEAGGFSADMKPPGMTRPRTIAELAPGYARIHEEAMARLRNLGPLDLERKIAYFDGHERSLSYVLWGALLHLVHHRGQLSLLCRLAGGTSPGVAGPNREEMAAMRAAAAST